MDIGLFLKGQCFDINVKNGDLEADLGLETAVAISLFTDRRVSVQQLPDEGAPRRGWWGDMFSEVDQDQIGSRLWTLARTKRTNETLRLWEDYAKEALNWLIEDGVSERIDVIASYDSDGKLIAEIAIYRPEGETRFNVNWDSQELKRAV